MLLKVRRNARTFHSAINSLSQVLGGADSIPLHLLIQQRQNSRSRFYHPETDSVKLLTMHSSKGLEFEAVCIPGVGYMPYLHGNPESEMRLFYVAMTRATERLLLTAHQTSEFVQRIEAGLQLMT